MAAEKLGVRQGKSKRICREGGRDMRLPFRKGSFLPMIALLSLFCLSVVRAQETPASSASSGSSDSSEESVEPLPLSAVSDATDRPYWRQNLFGRFFRDQEFLFTTWWPAESRRAGFTLPLLGGIATC